MTKTLREISCLEYSVVREGGAGLIDLSSRGRILVSGAEALMFLNGLVTNDLKTLELHSWMPAAFANVQGRLLAAVRVMHREDGFLFDTESSTRVAVIKLLERFTLAGDFCVADLSDQTAMLSVQGQKAADVVHAVFGNGAVIPARYKIATFRLKDDAPVTAVRATHTAEDGTDFIADIHSVAQLRDLLTNEGAVEIGEEVVETLRIEAGIPRYGIDMDETTVVTETNLDDAVSFTKGCYLGQEIIVRIKHRGHVAKKLTGLIFKGRQTLAKGDKIFSIADKEIGRITSSAFSPQLDRAIGLGYVKYDFLAPGTAIKAIAQEQEYTGRVVGLPFVRGSWYEN